mmetsp:Transcript_63978/g.128577  ORF Transcript_63978/g.128577 Transcript_63978/m.128577 type:complete len:241 (-) Transcript_63978:561-1283(-)
MVEHSSAHAPSAPAARLHSPCTASTSEKAAATALLHDVKFRRFSFNAFRCALIANANPSLSLSRCCCCRSCCSGASSTSSSFCWLSLSSALSSLSSSPSTPSSRLRRMPTTRLPPPLHFAAAGGSVSLSSLFCSVVTSASSWISRCCARAHACCDTLRFMARDAFSAESSSAVSIAAAACLSSSWQSASALKASDASGTEGGCCFCGCIANPLPPLPPPLPAPAATSSEKEKEACVHEAL